MNRLTFDPMTEATPLDTDPPTGHPPLVLLRDLRQAVDAYCTDRDLLHKDVAEKAGLKKSALSRALAAGRPEDEGPSDDDPRVSTAERIAGAVECRLMVVPESVARTVERLVARSAKRRGGGA